jgi:hypothetical protein
MRVSIFAVVVCGVCIQGSVGLAQGAAGGTAPAAAAPAQAGPVPSAMMQPAVNNLRGAIDGMHADKWKIPGALKDETEANLSSIRKDLDGTLAVLLATADGAPGTVSALLPAYRNVEALYDVVLRVDAAARVGAPAQQSQVLDSALSKLDESRRGFGDHIMTAAQAQEKQVSDLQASLKTAQATPPPGAPVCPTPATTTKKPPAKKPAAKPAVKPATPPPSQGN